jgi:hypothetical protein
MYSTTMHNGLQAPGKEFRGAYERYREHDAQHNSVKHSPVVVYEIPNWVKLGVDLIWKVSPKWGSCTANACDTPRFLDSGAKAAKYSRK